MEDIKKFQIRISRDLWIFLRRQSIEQENSMNRIVETCLTKYKKSLEKRLTDSDTMVL